jgi:hypothetical protein
MFYRKSQVNLTLDFIDLINYISNLNNSGGLKRRTRRGRRISRGSKEFDYLVSYLSTWPTHGPWPFSAGFFFSCQTLDIPTHPLGKCIQS